MPPGGVYAHELPQTGPAATCRKWSPVTLLKEVVLGKGHVDRRTPPPSDVTFVVSFHLTPRLSRPRVFPSIDSNIDIFEHSLQRFPRLFYVWAFCARKL